MCKILPNIRSLLFSTIAILSANATIVNAQSLNGWCFPTDACMGAQTPIIDRSYGTCEETCKLINPTAIRGMNATLFDEVCKGDWMQGKTETERVLVIQQRLNKSRVFLIRTDTIIELERCY